MAGHSQVLDLVEELLDSGKTPEEVCRDCPELISEVRRRWQEVRLIDAQMGQLFPGQETLREAAATAPSLMGLPQIPGYAIEEILGHGGMGVVFRARHLALNRLVALKMALAGAFAGPLERERFRREAEAVAMLRHPNVVQIHDVGDADGRPYFTMEYVEGGSLAQKLAGTPLAARQTATMVATLARAVQAAHDSGIVHRDLKPGNVLLTSDGIPKISDFGLARRLSGEQKLTLTGAAIGTPSYMAPEQAQGPADRVGRGTDVYALGAILYELLTGRPPFRAETAAQTVYQVISQEVVPPSRLNAKVPRDLETICLKCLQKTPQRRYLSAGILADDLERFDRGEAIAARPDGLLARWRRRIRRRPALSAAITVSLLLAFTLIGGGVWLLSDRAATVRAAEEDLADMVQSLNDSAWSKAQAAWDRAKGRLRSGAPPRLSQRLEQGRRDMDLAARLEGIRLAGAGTVGGVVETRNSGKRYDETFRAAGLGSTEDTPQQVAARIKDSHIRNALVSALDHWSVCPEDPAVKKWVLETARRADSDESEWCTRARDPEIRKDYKALDEFSRTAPIKKMPIGLVLAIETSLNPFDSPAHVELLKVIHQHHPDDFWANSRLGWLLSQINQPYEAVGYLQAALAIRPDSSMICNNLGRTLMEARRPNEAVAFYRRATELDPTAVVFHANLVRALSGQGRHDHALAHLKEAMQINPDSATLHSAWGQCLENHGRPDEAFTAYSKAVEFDHADQQSHQELRKFLMRRRRTEEALVAWKAALTIDPAEHDAWYGYAELSLFHGQVDEYRRGRTILLEKFGTPGDPLIAERTARSCLLLPAPAEELERALVLVNAALAADRTKYAGFQGAFQFVKGLASYREGNYEQAIATMRGDASRVLGQAPRLILAMALHKKGDTAEARQMLMAAVLSHNWKRSNVYDQDGCICHVLRREAEGMLLPNLPAFLEGHYEPQSTQERLSMIGVCQLEDRNAAAAKLYGDSITADLNIAGNFRVGFRYQAARHAAQAGCDRGMDSARLDESQRARWRAQARDWLLADLAGWRKDFENGTAPLPNLEQRFNEGRTCYELAVVREKADLERLPTEEQQLWVAYWSDADALLDRVKQAK